MPRRHAQLATRIAAAVGGPADRHAGQAFATHFANQYVGFSFDKLQTAAVPRYLTILGLNHVRDALRGGSGVVVAHPHMGLPQLPLHVLGLYGFDVHQVGGGQVREGLSRRGDRVAETRAMLERRIAATLHDGTAYLRPVLRALNDNAVMFTACDGTGGGREIGRRVAREVLGRTLALPVFPVWLARHSDAPICTMSCWRNPRGDGLYTAEFHPPFTVVDDGEALDRIARFVDDTVRRHPGDWHLWDVWHEGPGGLLQ
jgi:lauroyl/myristoyl acyltransferase